MPLQQALDRLLAGSGCRAVLVDPADGADPPRGRRPGARAVPCPPAGRAQAAAAGARRFRSDRDRRAHAATSRPHAQRRHRPVGRGGRPGGRRRPGKPRPADRRHGDHPNLGPGRDKVFLRGLSDGAFTGRTQSTVGLYLDDAPITYNAPDPDLRLIDIRARRGAARATGHALRRGSIGGIVRDRHPSPRPRRSAPPRSPPG